ncbi:MAG: hypothetical protein JNK54_05495 [Elusimicrobia bacterium]|nr:hypothetical protein [Elusimicrobiota bacterium]
MNRWRLFIVILLVWGGTREGRVEEDVVSYDERLTRDGEDPESQTPLLFSGDVRLRVREVLPKGSTYHSAPPELQHNVYFYQRTRLSLGPVSAGGLAKRSSVGPALSLENLDRYGTLKGSVEWNETNSLRRAVLGNYSMVFGQGLLFYDGFGEFVRPVQVKDKGPRPDYSTGVNDYLRGAAGRFGVGSFGFDLFVSEKPLDFPLSADGRVNANLDHLHEGTSDVQTEDSLQNNNGLTERLAGGRMAWKGEFLQVGVSGYGLRFSRPFHLEEIQFSNARAYRGDGLSLSGLDVQGEMNAWRFVSEIARSRASGPGSLDREGVAWTGSMVWGAHRSHFWLGAFDYDADFISPHGKGLSFGVSGGPESLPRNQRGGVLGGEWVKGPWKGRVNVTLAQFPEAKGNGTNADPIASSQGRYFLTDQRWAVKEDVEVRLMFQERVEEKLLTDPVSGFRRQGTARTQKWRGAVGWEPTRRTQWSLRHDIRLEETPLVGRKVTGRMWVADAVFKPRPGTRIKLRTYFFNSPEAYLTTGPEEIWDGVVYDRLAGNLGSLRGTPGTRTYLIVGQTLGSFRFWGKYEITSRPAQAESREDPPAPPRRAWHVQVEARWGKKQ